MNDTTVNPSEKVLMAPQYHLELVKDRDIPYDANARTTEQAAQVLHGLLDRSPTENFAVMYLNSSAEILGVERVGMGDLESVETRPTEIFRGALVKAAPEVLMCHNHPSGNVKPSPQDLVMTFSTINMGSLLGIRVRDHIVVSPNGKHFSIRENFHLLHEELRRAEELAYGPGMTHIKSKILDLLHGGYGPEPYKKPGGDPKANSLSDWKESLTWLVLNTTF